VAPAGTSPAAVRESRSGSAAGPGNKAFPAASPVEAATAPSSSSPLANPSQPNLPLSPPAAPLTALLSNTADASPMARAGCGDEAGGSGTAGGSGGESAAGCAAPSPVKKAGGMIDFALSQFNRDAFEREIAREYDEVMRSAATPQEILMIGLASTSVVLTAGVVGWLLRGGALLSAFLSSMPLWRGFDPLVVVMRPRRADRRSGDTSKVDAIFDPARRTNDFPGSPPA
jgi:hypothetical protein